MPGFERNRFYNLSLAEEEELNCGVCDKILCNPSVVPCCGQTYCNDCIHKWINTYHNCPFDKSSLKVGELQRTQKIVTNLINKLSIKCDFHENGCRTICQLGVLSTHTQNCYYNPQRKCDSCDNLKITNRCLKTNVKTLESLNEKLREENENLVVLGKSSQNDCMFRAIDSARKQLNHSIVCNLNRNYMNESELIRIAQNAIIDCNCFNDIAIQISKAVNTDHYNHCHWNTIAFSNKCCAINAFRNDDSIQITFGDLTIKLIKYLSI